MFVKKIYFCGSILLCGISNINAGCSGNIGKNLEIDLDNFKYNNDIFSDDILVYHLIDLDNDSIKKINNIKEEIKKLQEKKKQNDPSDIGAFIEIEKIEKEIEKKQKEIEKVKLNKFYFYLYSLNGEKDYKIRCKKTNVNIKGYQKAKEEYKEYLDLLQKDYDSSYEGGIELSDADKSKLEKFKDSNGNFFILTKITYLEKKHKYLNELQVVPYTEIIDIYKKIQ